MSSAAGKTIHTLAGIAIAWSLFPNLEDGPSHDPNKFVLMFLEASVTWFSRACYSVAIQTYQW